MATRTAADERLSAFTKFLLKEFQNRPVWVRSSPILLEPDPFCSHTFVDVNTTKKNLQRVSITHIIHSKINSPTSFSNTSTKEHLSSPTARKANSALELQFGFPLPPPHSSSLSQHSLLSFMPNSHLRSYTPH